MEEYKLIDVEQPHNPMTIKLPMLPNIGDYISNPESTQIMGVIVARGIKADGKITLYFKNDSPFNKTYIGY